MQRNNTANKVLSIVLSVIMALSTMSVITLTSFAQTSPVQQGGIWNYASGMTLNSAKTSFSGSAVNTVWMGAGDMEFTFMQTEDSQQFSYSTALYMQKQNQSASVVLDSVATAQNDSDYASLVISSSWTGTVPSNYTMTGSWGYGTFTSFPYTESFTANGRAVYHPEWVVTHHDRNNTYTTDNLSQNVAGNPVFTITVVDMRELLDLIDLAQTRGKDTTAVLSGFDTTGATYYSQAEVDAKADEVAALMCADYTALNAAVANAEALGENSEILGGKLYDETTYNAMAAVLAEAKAINRRLEDTAENNAMLNAKAAELQAAVDGVIRNVFDAISYYVDGVLYATVPFAADGGFNFHDVTDHFVDDPVKANATFDGWRDADGNKIKPNTPVTSSFSVYAHFAVDTRGAGPVEQFGRYDHPADANYADGRGSNGVTLWVENNNFNFVQTKDNQEFSFNAAVSAVKNDPAKFARVTSVVFRDSNTAFIKENNLSNDDIEYYCETDNAGAKPADSADGNLPGVTGATFEEQMANSVVRWRYIYTFPANGEKHYTFDWTVKFKSGNSSSSTTTYTEYVTFNINVTDLREIIQVYAKARSVANDANSPLSPARQAELVALVENIDENYNFDGTEYYPQTEVDDLVSQLNSYIQGTDFPCDYTELDAAIALAATYDNSNHQYIDSEWALFTQAYNEALAVTRGLYIDDDNVNQPMIDAAAEKLEYAIEALSYKTHQNPKADTTALEEAVDNAESIINANPDAYTPESVQDLQDAIDAAQDIIDNPPYDNGDGTADQIIQDAIDAINNALNALTPDKTALEEKIEEGENTDTTGMTPDSVQDLQDAIDAAEDVLNDPDATVQEIQDAIDAIDDAINNLKPDKTELENAIADGNDVIGGDTSNYDPASVQALEDAITAGETVYNDPDATVQEIKDATDAIRDALANLLIEAVNNAEDIINNSSDDYTLGSIQDLENAVSDAQDVINNPNSTPDEIKDAIEAINDAINNLAPDKTELADAISNGNNIVNGDTSNYTPASVQVLEDALSDGQDVYDNADATVQEIKAATEAIRNALENLLEQAVDNAEDIVNNSSDDYTDSSIQALQDAIDDAQDVINNPNSTAEEIKNAIDDINNAIDNLTPDKSALEAKIQEGYGTDTSSCTSESAADLADAIAAGETVYNDPDATVQEIKDAIDAIDAAIAALRPDKSALEQAIIDGQNEAADSKYVDDQNMQNLLDVLSDAQDVYNDPDATLEEVNDAIDAINDAINMLNVKPDLNVTVYDDEGNVITSFVIPYGAEMTFGDISTNLPDDISDYKDHDEIFLGWTDYDGRYYNDTDNFDDPQNAGIYLSVQKTVITENDNSNITVDRYTENQTDYTYLVGLNPAGTSVEDIVAQLKNRGTEIIVTTADGNSELYGNDLVGTGCLVKCVNALDHSIVYEVATVILYGDVNGDGLVDGDDKSLMNADAFFGGSNIETGTVYYIAADLAKDGTLDAFDYFYVDGIMTGGREFNQKSELYK